MISSQKNVQKYRTKGHEQVFFITFFFHTGDELMVKKACFKNKLHSLFGDMLDIPPWWDFRSYYNATLAHMVNNRFEPFTNCKFGAMEHPRFGWVSSKPFLIYYSVNFNFHLKSVNSNFTLAVHPPKLWQAKTHFLSHFLGKKEKKYG